MKALGCPQEEPGLKRLVEGTMRGYREAGVGERLAWLYLNAKPLELGIVLGDDDIKSIDLALRDCRLHKEPDAGRDLARLLWLKKRLGLRYEVLEADKAMMGGSLESIRRSGDASGLPHMLSHLRELMGAKDGGQPPIPPLKRIVGIK
jgi:hypothetical protein